LNPSSTRIFRKKIWLSRLNPKFVEKIGLSRINPIFGKQNQDAPAQPDF